MKFLCLLELDSWKYSLSIQFKLLVARLNWTAYCNKINDKDVLFLYVIRIGLWDVSVCSVKSVRTQALATLQVPSTV